MMCELLKQHSAPKVDVNILEGSIKNYHDLMATFNGVMEKVGQFKVYKVGKECSQRICHKLKAVTYLF